MTTLSEIEEIKSRVPDLIITPEMYVEMEDMLMEYLGLFEINRWIVKKHVINHFYNQFVTIKSKDEIININLNKKN